MDHRKAIRTTLLRLFVGLFVGVSFIVVSLIAGREKVDVVLPAYVCALALAIALYEIVSALIKRKRIENNYVEPVACVCVGLKEVTLNENGRINRRTIPVYRFTLDDAEYTVSDEVLDAYAEPPQLGETRTLMIDRNNPDKYADPDEDRRVLARNRRTAIPLIAIAVVVFIVFRLSPQIVSCFTPPAG